jgi:putative hydrolase of the HAD superfamily
MRAVLFDLGNTLVAYYRARDFAPILRESIAGICEFLAERKSSTVIDPDQAFQRALTLNAEDPKYRVRPLEGRLLEIFRDDAPTSHDLAEMQRVFLRPIFQVARLDADALPTLAALRQRGFRTAIVSNTPWGSPAEHWAGELRRHGLTAAVDAVVFCVDVGWRKPAPQIFRHALSLLGVKAQEAAFVGDDPRWDIVGAEESGLRPILLDPAGDWVGSRCQRIRSLRDLIPLLDAAATE